MSWRKWMDTYRYKHSCWSSIQKSKSALLSILPHVQHIHTENWNCVTLRTLVNDNSRVNRFIALKDFYNEPRCVKYLKGSYDVAKKNISLCIWCNAMCLHGSRLKNHIIVHILYIIVAPLWAAFLKRANFYKAHRSEKRGVLWLASYPVRCDWPNTSSVWRKCYAPYHVVMPCPGATRLKQ